MVQITVEIRTFTLFIHPCEGNSDGKSVSEWYPKFIKSKSRKRKKKIQKFHVSEIIASENVAINHLGEEDNTYYRESIGYQTVLQFIISLRETF